MAAVLPGSLCRCHVLIAGGDEGTSSFRYRVGHTEEQLRLAGIPVTVIPHGACITALAAAGGGHAVLFLHRMGVDRWVEQAIDQARRRRWPVVADIDDLVFDVGVTPWVRGLGVLPPGSVGPYNEGVAAYRRCLEVADAIVVPSANLAREAAKLGRPVFVHRNALSTTQVTLAEAALSNRAAAAAASGNTIGYFSGTFTHDRDFRVCSDALVTLMARRPEVRLLLRGPLQLDAKLEHLASRIAREPLIDWRRLPAAMLAADVNIAPLETDNPFCQAKSELKYIEAGILGLPTVASPTEAFGEAILPGRNGFLPANRGEWEQALDSLVADPGLRRRLGEAARRDVYQRYHPRTRSAELVRTLAEIVNGVL